MSDDAKITIEVDGQQLEATPGQMLIEITDAAGITVPRFCYHKKLTVAANCRMCLVEVEKAPKPLPACATPVTDGMKVHTRSPLAREAQKGTMEFLLINHPLDCPICDQGGECELQDVAVGYGSDVSRYHERKRVVRDEDIGPLIATEMTRCIHCTRCVRFGGEIAGLRELGATGRGEHMRIGVYVEHAVSSELSGNIIDLCPVGALTSRPFQYRARAWELSQRDSVALHDGVGANVHVHVRRNQILRVVPRENEAVNETWIADRERFSYQALQSEERIVQPLLRENGALREAAWEEALAGAAEALQAAGSGLGTLVSPNATLEEMFLSQRLSRGLGSSHIDHRLRQSDFRGDAEDAPMPWTGSRFAELSSNQATLLVGSWLRKDQPLLNHRLRQSVLAGGAVMAINPVDYDFNYPLVESVVTRPSEMVSALAGVAAALGADAAGVTVEPDATQRAMAQRLKSAGQGGILLGVAAHLHPDFSLLRRIAANIAEATGCNLGLLPPGANVAGAHLVGVLPHRYPGGRPVEQAGLDAMTILAGNCKTLLLFDVDPEFDVANPALMKQALAGADKVVAISSFDSPWLREHADIVLPLAAFGETSGTLVNLQGDWQSFCGVVEPKGEARPGWKILRVLGNLTGVSGFDFLSTEEVINEIRLEAAGMTPDNRLGTPVSTLKPELSESDELQRVGSVAIYDVDAMTRRSPALQATPDAWTPGARVHSSLAERLGLVAGDEVRLSQAGCSASLPLQLDDRVPDKCVWLPMGSPGSENLAAGFGPISLEKC